MNFAEVKKSVGDRVRLRPIPARFRPDGCSLPLSDDAWLIKATTRTPQGIHLVNVATKHRVHLQLDDLREFHSPDLLVMRCALIIKGKKISIDSSLRGPIPATRYQTAPEKITEQWIPVDSQICDGCTVRVQYRPMIRITLPADGQSPAITQQFCAPCARERRVSVVLSAGMPQRQAYARSNPTFSEYLSGVMRPVVSELERNPELKARGVTRISGPVSPEQITFQLLVAGEPLELPIDIQRLEDENIRSQTDLSEFAAAAIRERLDHRK